MNGQTLLRSATRSPHCNNEVCVMCIVRGCREGLGQCPFDRGELPEALVSVCRAMIYPLNCCEDHGLISYNYCETCTKPICRDCGDHVTHQLTWSKS